MLHARRTTVAILAIHLAAGLLFLAPSYIRPDSIATYQYLRSAAFDGDLAFFNEWASAGLITPQGISLFSEVSPNGSLSNHWWIGTSLLSAVPYLAVRLLAPLAGPWAPPDGFGGLYAVALAWVTVACAAGCVLVAWRLIAGYARVTSGGASLSVAGIVVGTPLFWYTYRFPLGTHLAAALSVALLLYALFRSGRDEALDGVLAGLAFGLAVATRIQHVVLLPAILYAVVRQRRSVPFWRNAILAAVLAPAAQAIAWNAVYGTPFGPLARGATLGGTTWMPFQNLAFVTVLTTSYHGLLSWSPVAGLAVAGWCVAWKDETRRTLATTLILMFAAQWFANGTLDRYFWGGMSFGARRFVDLAVPFMIGLAWLIERAPRAAGAATAAASAWSVLLMVAAHGASLSLSRFTAGSELVSLAFSPDAWSRAATTPLHSAAGSGRLFLQSVAAIAIVAAVATALFRLSIRSRLVAATAFACACVLAVAFCAIRTPERARQSAARLRVDMTRSRHAGPLLDQRHLLGDEVAWADATGRTGRARATREEIARIDAALRTIAAR